MVSGGFVGWFWGCLARFVEDFWKVFERFCGVRNPIKKQTKAYRKPITPIKSTQIFLVAVTKATVPSKTNSPQEGFWP